MNSLDYPIDLEILLLSPPASQHVSSRLDLVIPIHLPLDEVMPKGASQMRRCRIEDDGPRAKKQHGSESNDKAQSDDYGCLVIADFIGHIGLDVLPASRLCRRAATEEDSGRREKNEKASHGGHHALVNVRQICKNLSLTRGLEFEIFCQSSG